MNIIKILTGGLMVLNFVFAFNSIKSFWYWYRLYKFNNHDSGIQLFQGLFFIINILFLGFWLFK